MSENDHSEEGNKPQKRKLKSSAAKTKEGPFNTKATPSHSDAYGIWEKLYVKTCIIIGLMTINTEF